MTTVASPPEEIALIDLLDRLLCGGVVLTGEVELALADIDLVRIDLRALIASAGTARRGRGARAPVETSSGERSRGALGSGSEILAIPAQPLASPISHGPTTGAGTADAVRSSAGGSGPHARGPRSRAPQAPDAPARRINAEPQDLERGLATLVLTIVELLRQLMERQALHRVSDGTLSDTQVERLGQTLMALAERMEELKQRFGLEQRDLNLDLGPLGKLL